MLYGETIKLTINIARFKVFKASEKPRGCPDENLEDLDYKIVKNRFEEDDNCEIEEMGADEYEVEAIRDCRVVDQRRQYLVKWKDYPEEESTWEPAKNLKGCQNLIQQFHEERNCRCENCGFLATNRKGLKLHKEKNHGRMIK